jgi:hypothetical protein
MSRILPALLVFAAAFALLASSGLSQVTTTYYFFEGNETSVNYTFPAFGGDVSDNYTKVTWNTLQSNDRMTLTPYQVLAEDERKIYRNPNGTFENYAVDTVLNDSFWYTSNDSIGNWDGEIADINGDKFYRLYVPAGFRWVRFKTLASWILASDYVCFTERNYDAIGAWAHVYYSVYNSSDDALLKDHSYTINGGDPNDPGNNISMRRCLNVSNHTGKNIYFEMSGINPQSGGVNIYVDDLSESNQSLQYPSDVQIETTHGYTVYTGSGELNSRLQVPNFYSAINQELLLCPGDEMCDIYFNVTSSTAGILEMSNLTFTETPIERNETQFNASQVAFDFKDCALDMGAYYAYGSQSYNWSCMTLGNVGHNFSALPTSQGEGSVDTTNPMTFPMMYVIPQSGYQNFNLTFTVAADEGQYYGGPGQPLISGFRNYGSLKILGIDTSHSGSYKSYWDVNIIPAGQEGSSQALKFTVRWYLANGTLKQVSKSYPGENAIICPACAGSGSVPQWINVKLVRYNSDYYVYYKHHYENESAWTLVASFLGSENAPFYSFERIGASNFNTDLGRYSTYLDNITGDFATYSTGGGTDDAYGYVRIDDGDGVMDSGDHMIGGAKVTLYSGSTAIGTDYTDADGYFEFADLADGYYMASVDVVQDPDGEYDTNFHEAFDVNIQIGKAFDETTVLSDGRGNWRSVGGNAILTLNTIETGILKAKVTTDGTTALPGAVITNSYYNGASYTVNDGYCTTNSSGECLLYLYSAYPAPSAQLYTIFASYGSATKSQITGVSTNALTSILFVMNYTQRYYIVPAEANRAGDFGEVTIEPSVIIVNQYIDDIYFKIWDVVESRYFTESTDGQVISSSISIDGQTFYLQREGSAFCLNYVQNPSIETCYVHYKHIGPEAYAINISLTLPGNEIASANIQEYPAFSVMREGRKLMTTHNATHQNISVEMLDDYSRIAMADLNASNFSCEWNSVPMGVWDSYSSLVVAGTGQSLTGTLSCTADDYAVFSKTTTFYLGDNAFDEVTCTINGGVIFPPTAEVPVRCVVESPIFCSQAGLKNAITLKINRAAQGAYDAWVSLPLKGDDPDSDSIICDGDSCCNPRILFGADDVMFIRKDGISQDAWEFLPEGTHYMDALVNDTSSALAAYFGSFLFTLDSTAPTTFPELLSVDVTEDILDSTKNFTCNIAYTNPNKQINHILVEINKIVNEADLDSPENVRIVSSIPSWYLESQPIQSTYVYPITYGIVSCDQNTLSCTYRGVTDQFSESTFTIKDGQTIICRASMQLEGGTDYGATEEDSARFIFTGPGFADGAVNFVSGIFNDPYAFLLVIIVLAVLMPIILILVKYLFV